jgi:hypothetical protein
MKEVVEKQEELQKKFLEAIEKSEHERMVQELLRSCLLLYTLWLFSNFLFLVPFGWLVSWSVDLFLAYFQSSLSFGVRC